MMGDQIDYSEAACYAPVIFCVTSGYTACQFEIRDMYHYAFGTNVSHIRFLHEMKCTAKEENIVNLVHTKSQKTRIFFRFRQVPDNLYHFLIKNILQHILHVFMIQIQER